jgi:hypothetical protein
VSCSPAWIRVRGILALTSSRMMSRGGRRVGAPMDSAGDATRTRLSQHVGGENRN